MENFSVQMSSSAINWLYDGFHQTFSYINCNTQLIYELENEKLFPRIQREKIKFISTCCTYTTHKILLHNSKALKELFLYARGKNQCNHRQIKTFQTTKELVKLFSVEAQKTPIIVKKFHHGKNLEERSKDGLFTVLMCVLLKREEY